MRLLKGMLMACISVTAEPFIRLSADFSATEICQCTRFVDCEEGSNANCGEKQEKPHSDGYICRGFQVCSVQSLHLHYVRGGELTTML